MDREEILSMSRRENKECDERERNIYIKSSAIAKAVGAFLSTVIVFIETVFFSHPPVASMAVFSVCFLMHATESWCRFINLKGKFNLIKSILYSVFTVTFIVSLIVLLCKW